MNNYKAEQLVLRAKSKDPDAFTALMDRQMQGMYRIARSILPNDEDAADAIQDTILTCWDKIGDLIKPQYFRSWLTRILINNCYQILRHNKNITYMEEYPEIPASPEPDSLEWEEALSLLDEKYRLVVVLFYSQGFKSKEIARILGLTDATVRTRLSRAREQLEKYYKE